MHCDALTSVIVVGVGLPQYNRLQEARSAWYAGRHGRGFEYAYLYPGMQKVCQALGRVVRSERDQGSALLLDVRYAEPAWRELLPGHWLYQGVEGAG